MASSTASTVSTAAPSPLATSRVRARLERDLASARELHVDDGLDGPGGRDGDDGFGRDDGGWDSPGPSEAFEESIAAAAERAQLLGTPERLSRGESDGGAARSFSPVTTPIRTPRGPDQRVFRGGPVPSLELGPEIAIFADARTVIPSGVHGGAPGTAPSAASSNTSSTSSSSSSSSSSSTASAVATSRTAGRPGDAVRAVAVPPQPSGRRGAPSPRAPLASSSGPPVSVTGDHDSAASLEELRRLRATLRVRRTKHPVSVGLVDRSRSRFLVPSRVATSTNLPIALDHALFLFDPGGPSQPLTGRDGSLRSRAAEGPCRPTDASRGGRRHPRPPIRVNTGGGRTCLFRVWRCDGVVESDSLMRKSVRLSHRNKENRGRLGRQR